MLNIPRVALYARFSSDNQRTESIDAQIRAMKKYCHQQHWQIVATYVDEAKSATTDKRPEFQRMIADSAKGGFDILLVHKLDRFSRDRYDSAIYKKRLKKNKVRLCSVLERIDDSSESFIMESLLEGLSEYYSKNLSREVRKGLFENALQGKATGGCAPIGFDFDENNHLVINEHEAEAVRSIFEMYADGQGYTAILNYLHEHGYKTKRGTPFLKSSLVTILTNEKYAGVYVYNQAVPKKLKNPPILVKESQRRRSSVYRVHVLQLSAVNCLTEYRSAEKTTESIKGDPEARSCTLCPARSFAEYAAGSTKEICGTAGRAIHGMLHTAVRHTRYSVVIRR